MEYGHMIAWIERQFGEGQYELIEAMGRQYRTDPELYGRVGWWRCHDDMVASGDTTL